MKTKKLILISLISFMMTSCMSTAFYQVYKITPESNISMKDSLMVYEDNNCKVIYDFWDDGGNVGFKFYNKTETNIYLNLAECFFINNGIANNYFKNRVYTNSSNFGLAQQNGKSMTGLNYLNLIQTNSISSNAISSNGKSISYNEEKIVCIPAFTSKIINEYSIRQSLYRDCDLLSFPTKKEIKGMTFTKENSPTVYSNKIEYKVGQTGEPIKFENKFYVSEITNYPTSEIITIEADNTCKQELMTQTFTEYFKISSPDMFYIKYTKEGELKH